MVFGIVIGVVVALLDGSTHLLLWVVRANRPARGAELGLSTRLRAVFSQHPMRHQRRIGRCCHIG